MRITKGISATFLLFIWSLFGGVILHGFNANLLTMLVSPIMESPIDNAEDVLKFGLTPILRGNGAWEDFLQNSPNPTMKKLGEMALVSKDESDLYGLVLKVLEQKRSYAWITNGMVANFQYARFYVSKESIGGVSPWSVLIVNKKWHLKQKFGKHIMRFQQVGNVQDRAFHIIVLLGWNDVLEQED